MDRNGLPSSLEDYLGRREFHLVGDRRDILRRWSGTLFAELVYPVLHYSPKDVSRSLPIRPSDIGLIVKTREEVGMPPLGREDIGSSNSATRRRVMHEMKFGNQLALGDAVVQAAGIVAFARNPEEIARICSTPVRRRLPEFTESLTGLISAQLGLDDVATPE